MGVFGCGVWAWSLGCVVVGVGTSLLRSVAVSMVFHGVWESMGVGVFTASADINRCICLYNQVACKNMNFMPLCMCINM